MALSGWGWPDAPASDAATLGNTSTSRSKPVIESTRCTAGVLTTIRIDLPLVAACLNTRTMALTPAESQNVVVLMSAISKAAPWFSAARSSSPTGPALVTSISAGSLTTATWPSHSTGKRSRDTYHHHLFGRK